MTPVARLKLSAVVFALSWTGWMVWWSGIYEPANIMILTICGTGVGYLWYRGMRSRFDRRGLLPRSSTSARPANPPPMSPAG